MKASFFRNVSNYEILRYNAAHYRGIIAEYKIIDYINLDDNNFKVFCREFKKSYDYLIPFFDKAIITNGVWKCVAIENHEVQILAMMDYYQYPRYLAIPSK